VEKCMILSSGRMEIINSWNIGSIEIFDKNFLTSAQRTAASYTKQISKMIKNCITVLCSIEDFSQQREDFAIVSYTLSNIAEFYLSIKTTLNLENITDSTFVLLCEIKNKHLEDWVGIHLSIIEEDEDEGILFMHSFKTETQKLKLISLKNLQTIYLPIVDILEKEYFCLCYTINPDKIEKFAYWCVTVTNKSSFSLDKIPVNINYVESSGVISSTQQRKVDIKPGSHDIPLVPARQVKIKYTGEQLEIDASAFQGSICLKIIVPPTGPFFKGTKVTKDNGEIKQMINFESKIILTK